MREPAGVHRVAATAVLAAFAEPGAAEREFRLPELGRSFPGHLAIGFHFVDYVVHAWDVAAALGCAWTCRSTFSTPHSPWPGGCRSTRPGAGRVSPRPGAGRATGVRAPGGGAAPAGPGPGEVAGTGVRDGEPRTSRNGEPQMLL
ncbi:hypothetical protein O1M54_12615 [Streptomyces diastatochromogenes]|nr:hypothetical protein [Streptomyces diastatochromogenes]